MSCAFQFPFMNFSWDRKFFQIGWAYGLVSHCGDSQQLRKIFRNRSFNDGRKGRYDLYKWMGKKCFLAGVNTQMWLKCSSVMHFLWEKFSPGAGVCFEEAFKQWRISQSYRQGKVIPPDFLRCQPETIFIPPIIISLPTYLLLHSVVK